MRRGVAPPGEVQGLYLGGRWGPGNAGSFEVTDPSDGSVIAHVADGDRTDAEAAVRAAQSAFEDWRRVPARERADVLSAAFELMHRDLPELADLISRENGKSLDDARAEVEYAAEFFRWFASEAVRAGGEYGAAPGGSSRIVVTHRPVGVAALVTPWNFPAAMVTRKIAPALAAGCTTVLRPASETPLTALAIARLLDEAGAPPGVVNVVPSTDAAGVAETWLASRAVRKLSFTGSTRVGTILLRQMADRIVNPSMELGGNAAFVVTQDADMDAAVAGALAAKFRNSGQACTAANRFYIHREVHDEFVARFGAAVAALRVGPAATGAEIGPLISALAVEELQRTVDAAVASGARVSHRARIPEGSGSFFAPTVLVEVPPHAAILDRELFGPVAPIVRWSDDAELLGWVNGTELGLASYVFSRDLGRALRLAESIDAGMVGINRGLISEPAAPFGGMKESGLGREGARVGMLEYMETQYLNIDWT
ncbi:NAD-dependent succinate-semialdehyde dehydrogenase [Nocardioides acrostichi]|uniref:NAD-dependent succinate-semialdehyde dehydrogenase n=1 Tax=Nocardioides acrostichi TaxID=2784339 RepID=A0A930UXM7_9ACTN|nr:NAD-dependent succinate-semialdehyde dehydrogenase [Nocardioides acrostichi]MBF4161577.1 NAD-dependent succinate-semialdehyde dehydrogenase [Nocardioides acrostichi]